MVTAVAVPPPPAVGHDHGEQVPFLDACVVVGSVRSQMQGKEGIVMANAADIVKASTEYYNRREFDRWLACYAADATFVDLSQGVTATDRDEIMAYGQGWVDALSDAAYADVRITEGGDGVTMQFNAQGVNDGPFGTFPATGQRVSFPVVNVITVNAQGEFAKLEQLYDRLDIMIQLGHIPPADMDGR